VISSMSSPAGSPLSAAAATNVTKFSMTKDSRILVTGAKGMVGRALVSKLKSEFSNVIPLSRAECDLEVAFDVDRVWKEIKPEFVFHIAAKVGGIKANISNPVSFLESNLLNEVHVLRASHRERAKRVLFLGSSCIYPRECPQPMKEEFLMTGPLEPTNEGYALAKIAGLKLGEAYAKQFGLDFVSPMPCNIYGPGDSFDLEHSHVLSALVKRFSDAKELRSPSVTLWGTGTAKREFIHLDDVVDGVLFCMQNTSVPSLINLGTGVDASIAELAKMVSEIVGFEGAIHWDTTKPDGMPRKCLDISKLKSFGFEARVPLTEGIRQVVTDYSKFRQQKGSSL
jgi:GDP-L-fucose synthase